MAWNPSPTVAVARDAAKRLGADRCVVVFTTPAGQLGSASYGETRALCDETKGLLDALHSRAMEWFEEAE